MAVKLSNGLFFSEILADNVGGAGFDTDGDGRATKSDEFIEIQSTSNTSVSLDGIQIWSAKDGLLYSFSSGETLDAGGTATIVGEYTGSAPAGFYDAGFANGNSGDGFLNDGQGGQFDTLYLVDTNTGEYAVLQYGDPPRDQPLPPGFPGTTEVGTESVQTRAPSGVPIQRDGDGDLTEGTDPGPGTPGVPCFAAGTRIRTDSGERPVESLAVGDMVMTLDRGLQPVRWIGRARLLAAELADAPNLKPIRIAAGALGKGKPVRPLVVSPQHRLLVASPVAERMFGASEVLVAAVKLLDLPGVERVADRKGVEYVHLLFDRHEIVLADGAPAESLYLGPMARAGLGPDAMAEICTLFPSLPETLANFARPVPEGRRARALSARLRKNGRNALEVFAG